MDVRFSARVRAYCAEFRIVSSDNGISYFSNVHRRLSKTKSFRHPGGRVVDSGFCTSCPRLSFAFHPRALYPSFTSTNPFIFLHDDVHPSGRCCCFRSFRRNFIKSFLQFEIDQTPHILLGIRLPLRRDSQSITSRGIPVVFSSSSRSDLIPEFNNSNLQRFIFER